MKLSLTDALVLFVVALAATVIGNLIVAKVVSNEVQSQAGATPLGKLLGAL